MKDYIMKVFGVNRIEVISDGREYVRYLKDGETLSYSLQDDGCTLKFFIDKEDESEN